MSPTGWLRNRLLRYDFAILLSSFLSAFSTILDRILLLLGLTFLVGGGAAVLGEVQEGAADLPLYGLAIAAVAVGALVHGKVEQRLAFLSSESVLVADALTSSQRVGYAAPWHGVALALLSVTLLRLPWPSIVFLWSVYALGIGFALRAARFRPFTVNDRPAPRARRAGAGPPTGNVRLAAIVASRQSFLGNSLPSALAIAGAAGMVSAAAATAASMAGRERLPLVLAGALALICLSVFSRVDPMLVRFTAFAGFSAGRTVGSHLPLTVTYSAIFALASLFLDVSVAILVILIGAGAAAILCLRILHYRLRPRRAADFAVQIEIAAAAALAFLFLPLAIVAAAMRILLLARSSRDATWSYA